MKDIKNFLGTVGLLVFMILAIMGMSALDKPTGKYDMPNITNPYVINNDQLFLTINNEEILIELVDETDAYYFNYKGE